MTAHSKRLALTCPKGTETNKLIDLFVEDALGTDNAILN
jgi:hypothetical protein